MISVEQKKPTTIIRRSTDIEDAPSVTIGIPVLNEEDHIERVVSGFLNTEYPNLVEVLVADGGSTDRTREIVQELSKKDDRVKLVDNPEKFQSFALNRMIEQAEGELFLRADGHCLYASDFIEKSVEAILASGAKNVGGTQRYIANNLTQAGTAIASKSFFGTGGAKYMDETFEGYSDTVFLGCFWLKDLKKLGGFSEVNRTNEDGEINLRVKEELNGKIYISPEIKIWYYPRRSFWKLFKQYFAYGRGRYITSSLHNGKIPFRSKAPFLFISILILLLALDYVVFDKALGSIYILAALVFLLLFESLRVAADNKDKLKKEIWQAEHKDPPGVFSTSLSAFMVLIIMHVAHFMGFGHQLIKNKLFNISGW